jgi:hypothetical protein
VRNEDSCDQEQESGGDTDENRSEAGKRTFLTLRKQSRAFVEAMAYGKWMLIGKWQMSPVVARIAPSSDDGRGIRLCLPL